MEQVALTKITIGDNIRLDGLYVEDLKASIERWGVLQPVLVSEGTAGTGGYTLVAGHRRLAACIELGFTEIPVVVLDMDVDPKDRVSIQYHENVVREDLSAWEQAQVTMALKELGLTQPDIAVELGLTKKQVGEHQGVAKRLKDLDESQLRLMSMEGLEDLSEQAERSATKDPDDELFILQYALRKMADNEASANNAGYEAERELEAFRSKGWLDDKLEAVKAAGINVVEEVPKRGERLVQWSNGDATMYNEFGWGEADIIKHRKVEECHVWVVNSQGYGPPVLQEWCKSPARHTAKGKSELKEASADTKADVKAKEKAERKEQKEAKLDRMHTVACALRAKDWKPATVYAALVPSVVNISHDTARLVSKALELDVVQRKAYGDKMEPDYGKTIEAFLQSLPATKQNAALVMIGAAEQFIEQRWSFEKDEKRQAFFDQYQEDTPAE